MARARNTSTPAVDFPLFLLEDLALISSSCERFLAPSEAPHGRTFKHAQVQVDIDDKNEDEWRLVVFMEMSIEGYRATASKPQAKRLAKDRAFIANCKIKAVFRPTKPNPRIEQLDQTQALLVAMQIQPVGVTHLKDLIYRLGYGGVSVRFSPQVPTLAHKESDARRVPRATATS